jgi:glucose/arabinose dehydrogenase
MGPRGGDELNLILPGRNYGWPIVSNGDNYNGTPIPDHPTRPDLEAPKLWWNPSISPSSLVFYTGSLFPQWKGSAFIGALSGEALIRVTIRATAPPRPSNSTWAPASASSPRAPTAPSGCSKTSPGRLLRLAPKG